MTGNFLNSRPLPCVIFNVERRRCVLFAQCFLAILILEDALHKFYIEHLPVSTVVVVPQPIHVTLLICELQRCNECISIKYSDNHAAIPN